MSYESFPYDQAAERLFSPVGDVEARVAEQSKLNASKIADALFASSDEEAATPVKKKARKSEDGPIQVQRVAESEEQAVAAVPPSSTSGAAGHPATIDAANTTTRPLIVDDWQQYEVYMMGDGMWWTWDEGIVDMKRLFPNYKSNRSEGFLLDLMCSRARWVLRKRECMFKVGMTTNLGARWRFYIESPAWKPSHMFILHNVPGRVAAGYVESAIIRDLREAPVPVNNNINFQRKDAGGTGQRADELLNATYYLYLVVRPTCE